MVERSSASNFISRLWKRKVVSSNPGNVYFKTRHPRHNLDRAAVQFRLCERVEAHEKALRTLIARCD